jgi:transcriptional regulator with XRE-family HTH domain
MRRRLPNRSVASKLVDYLVEKRGLSQNEIADVLEVDKSFVSRVRAQERDLSPEQMSAIADHMGVPMGAMLMDAVRTERVHSPEKQKILDMCESLMNKADQVIEAARAERAAKAAAKRPA